ncbi:MAG: DNA repair protein RecN [Gammaproteobacteria bacterium]
MLAQLHIRNLAVIDEVELEFQSGLTVLTGETGAGKSILVDALALALGERADTRAIRAGAERCEITAAFDIRNQADVMQWLADNDLDEDDECIIRRVVTADGRSRGYINGRSVPMQTLRELGERLVDICGQQSHQSLRHTRAQRELLDQSAGHQSLLDALQEIHAEWSAVRDEHAALREAADDVAARTDLLRHQLDELDALNPQHGEFEELERAHKLSANLGRIAEGVSRALDITYDGEEMSAHSLLSNARRTVDELVEVDVELATAASMLAEAEILIAEAADSMRHRVDRLEHDPAEEARIEQRLASFHELGRKHRAEPGTLPDVLNRLTGELDSLESSDQRLEDLTARLSECRGELDRIAQELTASRNQAASKLGELVTANMQTLGMPQGRFEVGIETSADDAPRITGNDRIEFRTAANPGQPSGPLAKVASGGELSRISLSLQVVTMVAEAIPTLIFDEVDAGVGGGVAEIVGGRLRDLSASRQVLCVTHLPQVASQADHHLRVSKITDGKTTRTTVGLLNANARVDEIARMLGGVEITERTRAHAEEMLNSKEKSSAKSRAAGA